MTSSYDFVIVGAGASGCLLAEKLTRSSKFTVVLLEAGTQEDIDVVQKHDQWFVAANTPELGWKLKTTPQSGCKDRQIAIEVGRLLGGCSSHNAQCYVRGNFNDWEAMEKNGCTGWNRKSALHAFKNIEKYEIDSEYHGNSGFIQIRPPQSDPVIESVKLAAKEVNIPWYDDLNAEKQLGIGYVWANVYPDYKRCGSYQAFIKPHLSRENLKVVSGAQASRILFEGNVAIGVEYFKNGNKEDVERVVAKREVIVSCGSLLSPWLLMLSGVGPKHHLEEHGIEVVQDLPGVGQNLSDHLFAPLWFRSKQPLPSKQEWCPIQCFGRSDGDYSDSLPPDYQIFLAYRKEALDGFPKAPGTPSDDPQILGVVSVLHPKSRGKVTLSSKDPTVNPLVDPNYLHQQEDLQVLTDCSKQLHKIVHSSAMSEWLDHELFPGKTWPEDENTYWRTFSGTMWHPVGTCRMGLDTDVRSVVDPRLRVINTKRLRVIDASVFPDLPSGNTQAPTFVIADRGADLVLEDNVY